VTEKHVNLSQQRTKDAQKAACRWIDTKPAVWTSDDFRFGLGVRVWHAQQSAVVSVV